MNLAGRAVGTFSILAFPWTDLIQGAFAQRRPPVAAIPSGAPRFAIIAERTTVALGKPAAISVELRNSGGRKMNAPSTLGLLLTITTLPTLQQARWASAVPSTGLGKTLSSLDGQNLSLRAAQSVLSVPSVFPVGRSDVGFQLTSHNVGEVRLR